MTEGELRQTGSTPVPDPTERTIAQLLEALKAERDYVDGQLAIRDERLRGIDTATSLRLDALADVRETLDSGLEHERELTDEKFASVAQQFVERDTRSEREARDNKTAVDAAFAASKEAAQKQDDANQKAIDKSENAMDEKVNKLEQLVMGQIDALADKIDDVKVAQNKTDLALGGVLQNGIGQQQQRTETRAVTAGQIGAWGLAAVIIIALVTFGIDAAMRGG